MNDNNIYSCLQKWDEYQPLLEFNPYDNFDVNYFNILSQIATNAYHKKTNTNDTPNMQFCHMYSSNQTDMFFYVPMLLIDIRNDNKMIWRSITMSMKMDYHVKCMFTKNGLLYLSPFHAWEEVSFWERMGIIFE